MAKKWEKNEKLETLKKMPSNFQNGSSPRKSQTNTFWLITKMIKPTDSTNQRESKLNLKEKSQELKIGTSNVGTMMSEDNVLELENAVNDFQFQKIGLSEVGKSKKCKSIIERKNNFIPLYYNDMVGSEGIGLMIHYDLKKNLKNFQHFQ